MTRIDRAGCVVLIGMLAGCGGGTPSTSDPGPPPPHGGNLVTMPGGKGYVEIVKKEGASATTPLTGEVSFYFLKDASTPYSPSPSAGTLTIGNKKVTLKAEGDALVTPNGPPLFAKGLDGVVSVELDGKTTTIPLGVR